ncbi:MAG: preprotein translocase, YajC subunit [Verrucomicrobiales bacterium]|nr:preprotein translocase, YajC subunit [Verrucomicrobiales bacterium]
MFSQVLNTLTPLLAEVQQTAPNPTGEMIKMVGMIALFGVMMYLLMIRPQQKKAKEHNNLLKGLRAGDKVITTSGIVGVVLSIKDKSVSLRSADTKLEVLKSAIAEVTERDTATEPRA